MSLVDDRPTSRVVGRAAPIAVGQAVALLGPTRADPSPAEAARERPNIVILLADDLQANCLGLLGHPVVKTPHLDALCREGFIFRNAYVAGSHVPAVCLPSRAMIQTGRSYHRDNRVWNTKPRTDLPPTLAETIRRTGYASIRSGKGVMNPNHLDTPFDEHIEYQNRILWPPDAVRPGRHSRA